MTLDQEVSLSGGQHQCASEELLLAALEELLRETHTPAEFAERLRHHPVVADCRSCRFILIRREACKRSYRTFESSTICRHVVASQPRAWPPGQRWPELEALAEDALGARDEGGARRFTATLRDLAAVAPTEQHWARRLRQTWRYLSEHVRARASTAQLGMAACLNNDTRLFAEACRRASLGGEAEGEAAPEADRVIWESAASYLERTDFDLLDEPLASSERPSGIRGAIGDVDVTPLRFAHPPRLPRVPVQPTSANPATEPEPFNPGVAFRMARSIEDAAAKLEELEATATRVCTDISRGGFPFAAVSMIRFDDRTIEAIAGCGVATEWVGRVRHPVHLHLPIESQDIQSNIVLSCKAEMVEPTDSRLDPFVRDHFKHTHRRYFIPLVMAYDEQGRYIDELDKCRWEKVDSQLWQLQIFHAPEVTVRVFGTLEVGIADDAGPRVVEFLRLANQSLKQAIEIYRCTMARVFDTIVTLVRRLSGAKSATLHYGLLDGERMDWSAHYCFRSELGKAPCLMTPANQEGAIGGNPRPGGLGETAIRKNRPRTRAGQKLLDSNPKIHAEGIRSMVALPLRPLPARPRAAGAEAVVGVVFLHRVEAEDVPDSDMYWIWFLMQRAAAAVRLAEMYGEERDRRFQLIGQHKAAKAMLQAVDESSDQLGQLLTGSMLNLSGADLGMLFRVRTGQDPCEIEMPCRAGKRFEDEMLDRLVIDLVREVAKMDAPYFFGPELLSRKARGRLLSTNGGLGGALLHAGRFVDAEQINFLGVLPIPYDTDVTAVLVLAYRRATGPRRAERRHLELLASSATAALKMGRIVGEGADAKRFASRVEEMLEAMDPAPPSMPPSARNVTSSQLVAPLPRH
jgi:hypothetical protein